MKSLVRPRITAVQYSSVLDTLITHDSGSVRVAASVLITVLKPPAHATRISEAIDKLLIGLDCLDQKAPQIRALVAHSRRHVELLKNEIAVFPEVEKTREVPVAAWRKDNPVFAALLDIPRDDLESLAAMAAAFVYGHFNGGTVAVPLAKKIAHEARSPASAPSSIPDCQRSWDATHQTQLQKLTQLALGNDDLDEDFQRAACSRFIWRSKLPGAADRHGRVDDRCLTEDAFLEAAHSLRGGFVGGEGLATAIATGWFSGLTWDLCKRIPLQQPTAEGWVIWLDIERGCYWVNLTRVARDGATAKGNLNYVAATKSFSRYLPDEVVLALRRLQKIRPAAVTLQELTGTADVPPEHGICRNADYVLKPSIARFYNSRSSVSRRLGISGPVTALALGEFARVVHSRLYYHTTTPHQLADALALVAKLLGWGAIRSTEPEAPLIGSEVVPESRVIATIARELASRVEATRPPRRYRWRHVRAFHNAFAEYMAFLISLGFLGRNREGTVVIGAPWTAETGVADVHDKKTINSKGATPTAACKPVREQLRHWFKHLECLVKRLDRLGMQCSALRDYVAAVLDGSDPSIVFTVNESGFPEPCGSAHVYGHLDETLKLKGDSARHLWDSFFSEEGVPDELADAQARRNVHWSSYWHPTSPLSGTRLRKVIATVQERVLDKLGIRAVSGLTK